MLAALNRNLRLYPYYEAATWEGISNAVWFLYLFSYKGLGLGEMALLVLLGDGVIVLSEIPTGALADRLGRRWSMLMGIILQASSAVLFIFGDSFFTFWLAMAACGLGDTFRSGADQALLYDSCLATNQEKRYRPLLASAMFIATVVMAGSQIAGGWIATAISWELPFWLEVGFSAFGLAVVLQMREPPRTEPGTENPVALQQPGRSARRRSVRWAAVIPLFAFATLIDAFPELTHFNLPAELSTDLGFTPLHLGFIYAAFELLQGFGNKLGGRRVVDTRKTLIWIAAGIGVCFAVFGLRPWLGLAAYLIGRAGIDLLWGISSPLVSEEVNRRTTSAVRATTLSVLNATRRLVPLGLLPLSVLLTASTSFSTSHLILLAGLALPLAISCLFLRNQPGTTTTHSSN